MSHHSGLLDTWLRLPSPDLAALRTHGIRHRAMQLVGGLRHGKDGRLLVPVWHDPPSLWNVVADPVLLAIVATDPARADRWNIVAGDDQVAMLGECMLLDAIWRSTPLPVFQNPLTWTRSGGAGVCPLNLPTFACEMLWRPEVEIVAEDIETGDKIKRAIDRAARVRKPKVTVEMKEAA